MIYEIHEVSPNIKNYKFEEDDVLVFDDGLYSQYYYRDIIENLPGTKYLAISSTLINSYNFRLNISADRNLAMWIYKEFR